MARKVRVVRKSEVEGNGVALLQEAQGRANGLLFANGAYTLLKVELRGLDLTNEATKVRPDKTYIQSHWGKDGMTGRVRIDYRVKLYTNSVDKEVFGKRVSIVA